MANIVFNIAKGQAAYFGRLPNASDALVLVPLQSSGLVSDAVMRDYEDLNTLLAGASNEHTMGRKTVTTGVTVTVDHTADTVYMDMPDQTWSAISSGGGVGALLICYDPDTTSGTDSSVIPLTKHDFVFTPDGGDIVARFATTGFYGAS